MTPRKVHYWLNTDLLSMPVRRGRRGYPTILSYRQVLEIRTVQHLRDDLDFSLRSVRRAFAWILDHLFVDEDLEFAKGVDGNLIARSGGTQMVVPGGQGVIEGTIPELNERIAVARRDWLNKSFEIPGYRFLITDALIHGGSPIVAGTRIETAMIARYVDDGGYDIMTVEEVMKSYPALTTDAVVDALTFEGVGRAA